MTFVFDTVMVFYYYAKNCWKQLLSQITIP